MDECKLLILGGFDDSMHRLVAPMEPWRLCVDTWVRRCRFTLTNPQCKRLQQAFETEHDEPLSNLASTSNLRHYTWEWKLGPQPPGPDEMYRAYLDADGDLGAWNPNHDGPQWCPPPVVAPGGYCSPRPATQLTTSSNELVGTL